MAFINLTIINIEFNFSITIINVHVNFSKKRKKWVLMT